MIIIIIAVLFFCYCKDFNTLIETLSRLTHVLIIPTQGTASNVLLNVFIFTAMTSKTSRLVWR
jgi:hypothetical protein